MLRKLGVLFVGIAVMAIGWGAGLSVVEAAQRLPTGGGYDVACLDYGIEMRGGKLVKSCLLATTGEFSTRDGQRISCNEKYSIAFRADGSVEYCTLSKDAALQRTKLDKVDCMAGGRVVFYSEGTLERAKLKKTMQLPYANNGQVICRESGPVSFRADGRVANCILDQKSVFINGAEKKTPSTCQSGGLITFDEAGAFNGCYPPPAAKEATPKEPKSQGGRNLKKTDDEAKLKWWHT